MINSKYLNKKILIPVAIIAVAAGLAIWGLPAIAVVNQTINSGVPVYTPLPTITGSVNVGQSAINFVERLTIRSYQPLLVQ